MKKYKLNNLDCASCASKIENSLSKLEDVKFVNVNFATATMTIDTDNFDKVKAQIKKLEPEVEVQDIDKENKLVSVNELAENKSTIIKAASAMVLLIVGIIFEDNLHNTPFQL
ncbi:MAG: heavy metal-associated domain-containing protein, partial [Bacteroidales bacterium]|nr:heavy metal-associated domain-containing protein [Bacteroidales bacterium]